MSINLNAKLVTKEGLLKYIEDHHVYRFYIGDDLDFNKVIQSPFGDDENASFGFFVSSDNEICFNDFRLGGGDFVKFVQKLFGLNYFEALSKIAIDMDISHNFHVKRLTKTSKDYDISKYSKEDILLQKSNNFILQKRARNWKLYDYVFWKTYGIDKETLDKYNVQAIDYIFINGSPIKCEKYAYCFIEYKDKVETYKIYQPYSKNYKWLNGHNETIWSGWSQLPSKGAEVIITKSLKDLMSITNILDIPSTSLQSESTYPKDKVIKELKERFDVVYLWYDNDYDKDTNWGRMHAEKLCNQYQLYQLEIEDNHKCKDFSDLIKKYGEKKAKNIWNKEIIIPY